jgi:hypothetical protein
MTEAMASTSFSTGVRSRHNSHSTSPWAATTHSTIHRRADTTIPLALGVRPADLRPGSVPAGCGCFDKGLELQQIVIYD